MASACRGRQVRNPWKPLARASGLEASLLVGVDLFDTAAMYSGGARSGGWASWSRTNAWSSRPVSAGWLSKAEHLGRRSTRALSDSGEAPSTSINTISVLAHLDPISHQGPGKVAICLVRTTGRVGPVSGGTQLGVWRPESDWRPSRTFGPLPRPGAADNASTSETADTTGRTPGTATRGQRKLRTS